MFLDGTERLVGVVTAAPACRPTVAPGPAADGPGWSVVYHGPVAGVVVVRGAWHRPWCWEPVVPALEQSGRVVRATELHRGSLPADTAAVRVDVDAAGLRLRPFRR